MSNIYSFLDTWNDGGVAFDAVKVVITNTASAAGSDLLDLSIASGGASIRFDKTGVLRLSDGTNTATLTPTGTSGLTLGGALTAGGNIALGSNYLSGDGGNEGVYVGGTGIVGIGTSSLTGIFVTPALCVGGSQYIGSGGRLIMDSPTDVLMQFATSGAFKGQWVYDVDWSTYGGMRFHTAGDSAQVPLSIERYTAAGGSGGISVNTSTTLGALGNNLGVIGDIASYSSFTNTSNYERLRIVPASGNFNIAAETVGTGIDDISITLTPAGTGLVNFSGATSSYPALKRSSTKLQVRLADDSGDAPFSANDLTLSKTITAAGTTSSPQTINKATGSVNFAASATSVTVNNSLVTTSSVILLTVAANDATMHSVRYVPGSGSFVIHADMPPTAETRVDFRVTN